MGNLNPKIVRLHSRDDVCVAIDNVAKEPTGKGLLALTAFQQAIRWQLAA